MSTLRRAPAQTVVIVGFALSATSGVISYLNTVTTRGYGFSSLRETVVPLLTPLMLIAATLAWWWLSQVTPSDEVQRTLLGRAYVAFALQYLLTSALVFFLVTPLRSFGSTWITSVLWLQMIGAFVSSIGLFLLARIIAQVSVLDQEMDTPVAG